MMAPLGGVRVLELSHLIAAPLCASVLADFGAEVIKVEPPAGDLTRTMGRRLEHGTSAMYAAVNRSKQGLVLDVRDSGDLRTIASLMDDADVMITNLGQPYLENFGLDASTALSTRPRLIYLHVTAFGADGPPGTDSLAQAATGMVNATGSPDGEGVRAGPPVVDVTTAIWGALATMIALEERRSTGCGQVIELSLENVSLHMQVTYLAMAAAGGGAWARLGNHSPIVCTPTFATTTQRICISLLHTKHWRRFCELVGMPVLVTDPRFSTPELRQENQSLLEELLAPTFAAQSASAWATRLAESGLAHAVERTYADVLGAERYLDSKRLFKLTSGAGETSLQTALPALFSATRLAAPRFAPSLDPAAQATWTRRD